MDVRVIQGTNTEINFIKQAGRLINQKLGKTVFNEKAMTLFGKKIEVFAGALGAYGAVLNNGNIALGNRALDNDIERQGTFHDGLVDTASVLINEGFSVRYSQLKSQADNVGPAVLDGINELGSNAASRLFIKRMNNIDIPQDQKESLLSTYMVNDESIRYGMAFKIGAYAQRTCGKDDQQASRQMTLVDKTLKDMFGETEPQFSANLKSPINLCWPTDSSYRTGSRGLIIPNNYNGPLKKRAEAYIKSYAP